MSSTAYPELLLRAGPGSEDVIHYNCVLKLSLYLFQRLAARYCGCSAWVYRFTRTDSIVLGGFC